MRRFIVAAGLAEQREELAKLASVVQDRHPDGVLFAGGIVENGSTSLAEKIRCWEHAFEQLGALGVFTAVIPGSADAPLREFLRAAKEAEIASPKLHVVHAALIEEHGVAIAGLGGELTEKEDCTEERLCCSRAVAEYFLRPLWQSHQPRKVLLLSAVPPGPLGGESGNAIAGDFIDSYHPSLGVVAGRTEQRGVQRIAHTLVVNPGRLADGSLAWLDWNRSVDKQVEFLNLAVFSPS